ncbi:MAG: ABC transporter permease [Bacteroidia bacterium]
MKRFAGFVRKEFYHIFRDYRSMIILFGMPIAQIMLFGFAISNEIKNAKIAILDNSKDHITQQITNKLLASGYFILEKNLQSNAEIEAVFREGNVKEVIIFEPDFAQKLGKSGTANIQILTDATDPNTATSLANYTNSIVLDYQRSISKDLQIPYIITPELKMYYNPELKSVYMFVPGLMTIILMLVSAMMTSISITREKELGTMEILMVSPLNPFQVIAGKVVPYLLLSIINATVILVLGFVVFGMPVKGNMFLLAAETILFIITALTLGIFISTVSNTQQTAMLLSMMGLMLPTILLSGFIFPIRNMPVALQVISNIIPARWFIIIIKNILLKGLGFSYVWKETLILLGMTLALMILSIKKYKIRLT